MARDILHDDGRRVDDHPDGEREPHHRHIVDRDPHPVEDGHTAEKADRYRNDGNKGGPQRSQEDEHDDRGEAYRNDDVPEYAVHRAEDELCVVGYDDEARTGGGRLVELSDAFLDETG